MENVKTVYGPCSDCGGKGYNVIDDENGTLDDGRAMREGCTKHCDKCNGSGVGEIIAFIDG
ncbi:unnamed protein product [marine sediment metagenome]|uniref:Uncharacterized protein n=1 Tax=marine sediment metagenome TaxID=412755 RepID=X0ZYW3_9ZZZZ